MAKKTARKDDREQRRLEVHSLLTELNNEKVVRSGGHSALLTRAERAYKTATEPKPIAGPLRHVASYRYAHLLLRSPNPDLARAEALFAESSSCNLLSVRSRIYHIAVLERLLKAGPEKGRQNQLVNLLREDFTEARQQLNREPAEANDDTNLAGHLQGELFNLLELSGYFTGLPYGELEGRSRRDDGLSPPDDWVIVGPEISTGEVHLSKDFAMQELEDRESEHEANPDMLFFILSKRISKLKLRRQNDFNHFHLEYLLPLALLLRYGEMENAELEELFNNQRPRGLYRQAKNRLKTKLIGLGFRPEDSLDGRGVVRLPSDLVAYGAVQSSLLKRF